MSYVKTYPPGSVYRPARALLFVIAENTFNDTGECRVGQQVLSEEADVSERTLRRYLDRLVADSIVARRRRPTAGGGRLADALTLCGFVEWLRANRPDRAGRKPTRSAGLSGAGGSEPAKLAGSTPSEPASRWPDQTGQQVAGSIESPVLDSRTTPPTPTPLSRQRRAGARGGGRVDDVERTIERLRREVCRVRVTELVLAPLLRQRRFEAPDQDYALGVLADQLAGRDLDEIAAARVVRSVLDERRRMFEACDVMDAVNALGRPTPAAPGVLISESKNPDEFAAWTAYLSRARDPDSRGLRGVLKTGSGIMPSMWPPGAEPGRTVDRRGADVPSARHAEARR